MLKSQLREIVIENYEESMALSQFAFQMTLTEEELAQRKQRFLSPNEMRLAYFEDEQLCAQASLLHLDVYINEVKYKMGGIAGVCTWPEHRRKGYVASLLAELLVRMREQQQSISMLHPFSFAFYRRYGWETYVERKHYEMDSSLLPARKPFEGSIERTHNIDLLMDTYEQYAQQYNGMLSRSKAWWEDRISNKKQNHYAIYRNHNGDIEGYIIYEVMQSEMKIHECIALHAEAERGIWHYISQHDSMIKTIHWTAPSNDQFTFTLDNPRIKQSIVPYFMARIVDVKMFIEQYRFEEAGQQDCIYIDISDQYAPWNNELFELNIEKNGSAKIKVIEKNDTFDSIKMDITTLAALLLCYQKLDDLIRIDRVEGSLTSMKRLQDRISERNTYLIDFF